MTPRPYRTNKTTQLHIRVSPEELGFIKSAAETSGKSVSDYIREKIGLIGITCPYARANSRG